MRLGDFRTAERWAREATTRGTGRATHFALLGHILGQLGNTQEAASAYQQALSHDPSLQEALLALETLQSVVPE